MSDQNFVLLYQEESCQSDGSLETLQHLWSSWQGTEGDPERQFGLLLPDTEMMIKICVSLVAFLHTQHY
jgi:hypothetical protein